MPKKSDPFDKFRNLTINGAPSIKDAMSSGDRQEEKNNVTIPVASPLPSPAPASRKHVEKSGAKEQISFFTDKEIKKALAILSCELDVNKQDLYEEALMDLLKKYHKA